MADNYLEQRMEDLRSGKLKSGITRSSATPARKGVIMFPFPPRRVMIIGERTSILRSIASGYLNAGCRAAILSTDVAEGEKMAHDMGVRYYPLQLIDRESIEKDFNNLLKAWRDVDIIVDCTDSGDTLQLICNIWERHKEKYPIPSDFGGRLIKVSSEIDRNSINQATSALSRFQITVNAIRMSEALTPDNITATVLFLSLPQSHYITGLIIP